MTRRRVGRGFSYRHPNGRLVGAETRKWVESLAIPPAWTDVWICTDRDGHLLATGVDDAGRTQYLYHPQWRVERDAEKFARVRRLAPALPAMRRELSGDLSGLTRGGSVARTAVEALALLLLDTGRLRIGSETYEQQNGSHGAATLLVRHVQHDGRRIVLEFPAKGAAVGRVVVRERPMVRAVRRLTRGRPPGGHLLGYDDGSDGTWHDLSSGMVVNRFHTLVGDEFSVKDLRTWAATVAAAEALAASTRDDVEHDIRQAIDAAADTLGDTATVARNSYVDPQLFEVYRSEGRTVGPTRGAVLDHSAAVRRRVERQLLELLE